MLKVAIVSELALLFVVKVPTDRPRGSSFHIIKGLGTVSSFVLVGRVTRVTGTSSRSAVLVRMAATIHSDMS